jgi:hypothetical protein
MATLTSDLLTLSIKLSQKYRNFGTRYEILFLWNNEHIINDRIIKYHREDWYDRSEGALLASTARLKNLVRCIENVLESNVPDFWRSDDPDLIISFYPDMFFPFLLPPTASFSSLLSNPQSTTWNRAWEEADKEIRAYQREQGYEPTPRHQIITVIVKADTFNFRDSHPGTMNGVALIMLVERDKLKSFYNELKRESIP